MSGPAPKPEAQKILEGNPGKRPIKREPKPDMGAPRPPDDLKGEAFAEWARIVPALDKVGLLSKVDRAYLVAYCEAWASFCEARENIHERGVTVTGRDGAPVRNPAAIVMKDSLDMMLKYGSKFGLSPADRARLATLPEDDNGDDDSAAGADLLS